MARKGSRKRSQAEASLGRKQPGRSGLAGSSGKAEPQGDPWRPWLLAGAVALLVARPLYPSESPAETGDGLPIVMLWLALAVVWMLGLLGRAKFSLRFGLLDGMVVFLLLWQVGAALVGASHSQARPAVNMLWEWVGLGMIFLLVRQWVGGAREMRVILIVLLAVAVALAGYGLFQWVYEFPRTQALYRADPEKALQEANVYYPPGSPERIAFEKRLESREPMATFALTNSLAGFLTPWLVVAVGIGLFGGGWSAGWRPRGALLVGSLLMAVCLLWTKSRSAYLATLLGLGTMAASWLWIRMRGFGRFSPPQQSMLSAEPSLLAEEPPTDPALSAGRSVSHQELPDKCELANKRPFWRQPALGCSGLILAGVLMILVGFFTGGLDIQVLTEAKKSLQYRWEYWQATWQIIRREPIWGCGLGLFRYAYTRFKLPQASEEIADPHSFLLEVWATGGTPAALALLGFLSLWAMHVVGRSRSDSSKDSLGPDPKKPGRAEVQTLGQVAPLETPSLPSQEPIPQPPPSSIQEQQPRRSGTPAPLGQPSQTAPPGQTPPPGQSPPSSHSSPAGPTPPPGQTLPPGQAPSPVKIPSSSQTLLPGQTPPPSQSPSITQSSPAGQTPPPSRTIQILHPNLHSKSAPSVTSAESQQASRSLRQPKAQQPGFRGLAHHALQDRPVFPLVGGVVGVGIGFWVGQWSSAPPSVYFWVVGLPLAVASVWALWPWVRLGEDCPGRASSGPGQSNFSPHLASSAGVQPPAWRENLGLQEVLGRVLALAAVALLVHLLAAGGISFPGVAGSFWLLAALATGTQSGCAGDAGVAKGLFQARPPSEETIRSSPLPTCHPLKEERPASRRAVAWQKWQRGLDRQHQVGWPGAAGGLVLSMGIFFACHQSAFSPVLQCQAALRQALRISHTDPLQAEKLFQQAALADPLSAEPVEWLSALAFQQWNQRFSQTPDQPAAWGRWLELYERTALLALQMNPEHAPGWLLQGQRFFSLGTQFLWHSLPSSSPLDTPAEASGPPELKPQESIGGGDGTISGEALGTHSKVEKPGQTGFPTGAAQSHAPSPIASRQKSEPAGNISRGDKAPGVSLRQALQAYQKALGCFQEAVSLYPHHALYRAWLAEAFGALGYPEGMIREARAALWLDDQMPHVERKLPDSWRQQLARMQTGVYNIPKDPPPNWTEGKVGFQRRP